MLCILHSNHRYKHMRSFRILSFSQSKKIAHFLEAVDVICHIMHKSQQIYIIAWHRYQVYNDVVRSCFDPVPRNSKLRYPIMMSHDIS